MLVLHDVRHIVDRTVGNVVAQDLQALLNGVLPGPFGADSIDLLPVGRPPRAGLIVFDLRQLRPADGFAPLLEQFVARDGEHQVLSVLGEEVSGGDRHQRTVADTGPDRAVIAVLRDNALLEAEHRFRQAAVDHLPFSGPDHIPVIDGEHGAHTRKHGRVEVGHRDAGLHRGLAGEAGDLQEPAQRQANAVKPRLVAVGSGLSVSG